MKTKTWIVALWVCAGALRLLAGLPEALHASREALAAGNYPQAVEAAELALELDPGSAQGWKQLARAYQLSGQSAQARTAVRSALAVMPADPELQRWHTELVLELMEGPALRQALVQEIPAAYWGSWDAKDLELVLIRWIEAGRWEDAEALGRAVAEGREDMLPALPDWLAALRSHSDAVQPPASPGAVPALIPFAAAVDAVADGRDADALEALDQTEVRLPGYPALARQRGWILYRQGQYAEAARVWQAAGQGQSGDWSLWAARAWLRAGEPEVALTAVEKVLAGDPARPEALFLKGSLLVQQQGEEAAEAFWASIPDTDLQAGARAVGQMRRLADLGQVDAAMVAVEPFLRAEGVPPFLQVEVDLLLTEWLAQTPPAEKGALLERISEWTLIRTGLWRDLGWSEWEAGRVEDGLGHLERALQEGVENPEELVFQVVARLLEENRVDEARAFYMAYAPAADEVDLITDLMQRNRVVAARPLLEKRQAEDILSSQHALYLAYARAVEGDRRDPTSLLEAFLKEADAQTPAEELAMVIEVFERTGHGDRLVILLDNYPVLASVDADGERAMTDVLEQTARQLVGSGRDLEALPVLERVLERDPRRPLWSMTLAVAERLQRDPQVEALLSAAPLSELPVWESARVEACKARRAGQVMVEIAGLEQSLQDLPTQWDLRIRLFELYLQVGQDDAALVQMEQVQTAVDEGEEDWTAELAAMLEDIGYPAEAAEYWDRARLRAPSVPYYLTSTARTLADSCRVEEALHLLERGWTTYASPTAAEMAAKFAQALGRPEEALVWVDRGVAAFPDATGLHRLRAEFLEQTGDHAGMAAEAALLVQTFPEDPAIQALEARALLALGENAEAEQRYRLLLEDPVYRVTALARLREIRILEGDPEKALEVAQLRVDEFPQDPEAQRLLGLTLAECRQFAKAVEILEPLADHPVADAVPVLLYRNVGACTLPGQPSVDRVAADLDRLAEDGLRPILIFERPRPHVMSALTAVLSERNQQAYLVGDIRVPVGDRGAWSSETVTVEPGIPYHIRGEDREVLRAEPVLPEWSSETLRNRVVRHNPYAAARLSLAKVLYWQNQVSRADKQFVEARIAGADPLEIAVHRGFNALRGGDLELAMREFTLAQTFDPQDPDVLRGLKRIQEARRPMAQVDVRVQEDSDDRQSLRMGVQVAASPGLRTRWTVGGGSLRVERDGFGRENGDWVEAGVQVFPRSLIQLEVRLTYQDMDSAPDWTGWMLQGTLPVEPLAGTVVARVEREAEETVEAVREGILRDRVQVDLMSRLDERWDLRLVGQEIFRSDGNHGRQVEGLLLRRLTEVPFCGIGVRARWADTDEELDTYYTPQELEKYLLYATIRGRVSDRLRLGASLEAGVAREEHEDWIDVWGGLLELGWHFNDRLEAGVRASHMESPRYDMDTGMLFLRVH